MILPLNKILLGDSRKLLKKIPNNSIDLIFTSPPYAEQRKNTYGGIPAGKYIEWFLPIAEQLLRIIKPSGSFFLNIKSHTHEGERDLYVMDLICALKRRVGFMFIDEFAWTKNAYPGKYEGRFKNAFEPVYHFTKNSPQKITFNPLACGTPIKEASLARGSRKQCGVSKNGSGMAGMNNANLQKISLCRPTNVVHCNNVSNQFTDKQLHSATFPEGLVEFFIKSFSNPGDVILDPFMGSGTVAITAFRLGREFIGMELQKKEFMDCQTRLSKQFGLFYTQ